MPAEMNLQRKEIPPNNILSDLDRAYTVLNYPLPTPDPNAPHWSVEYALQIAGVTGSPRDKILGAESPSEIRRLFSLWNASQKTQASTPSDDEGDHTSSPSQAVDPITASVPSPEGGESWCNSESQSLVSHYPAQDASPSGPEHAVSVGNTLLWVPGYSIKYYFQQDNGGIASTLGFLPKGPYTRRRRRLERAFREYEAIVNLKFEEVSSPGASDIRIFFASSGNRNWSLRGTAAKKFSQAGPDGVSGLQGGLKDTTLFLTFSETESGPNTVEEKWETRHINHELGHVLGLLHEHESPVTETGDTADPYGEFYTPFDRHSIMLYSSRQLVDEPVGVVTQLNIVPSTMDRAFLTVRCNVLNHQTT